MVFKKWFVKQMVILGAGSYAIDFQDESVLALNKKKLKFPIHFQFFRSPSRTVWKSIAPDPALNIFIVNFLKESVISRIVKTEYIGIRH